MVVVAVAGIGTSGCGRAVVPPSAPTDLRFERHGTQALVSWSAVPEAESYRVDFGDQTLELADTRAEIDVGSGQVRVAVSAARGAAASAAVPFPVLYDVVVRACGANIAEATWTTDVLSDTATSFDEPPPGSGTRTCFDPTPRSRHGYGDLRACSPTRTPQGVGGLLTPNTTYSLLLLSRDSNGFLGSASTALVTPPAGCLCISTNPATCGTFDGCHQSGFDLEAGTPAAPADADIYLAVTESSPGILAEVSLHAPHGVVALPNTYLCDVLEAPSTGYATSVLMTSFVSAPPTHFEEHATSFVVKTSAGRFAKLSLDCNCPVDSGPSVAGMRFGYFVAPAGSATFAQ